MLEIPVKVRTFLEAPRFGVLATVGPHGKPQQSVMWYDLVGDTILMNTAEGRVKATNLRGDPRVSLCVPDEYRFVTIYGQAHLIDDQERAQADIAALARRYLGPAEAEASIQAYRQQTRVTILVPIEHVVTHGL